MSGMFTHGPHGGHGFTGGGDSDCNTGGDGGGSGGENDGPLSVSDCGGDCDSILGATINADVQFNTDIGLGDCSLLNLDGLTGLDLDLGADLGLA